MSQRSRDIRPVQGGADLFETKRFSAHTKISRLLLPDCAPQLAHHVKRTLLYRAVLVDSDVDRRDGLVFDVGFHVCDQVLGAELRRWNRACFAMHP